MPHAVVISARKSVPVSSLREASAVVAAHRDSTGMGASDMGPGFGAVVDDHDRVVARVSYNARVWPVPGKPTFREFARRPADSGHAVAGDALDAPL